MTKITWKIATEYVRILGGSLRSTVDGEHKLKFGSGDKEESYFTDSPEDAIGTARCMKGSHPNIEQAEDYLNTEMGVPRETVLPRMSEVQFRVAFIQTGPIPTRYVLYSRCSLDNETYIHGQFDMLDSPSDNGLSEAIYSIELRCQTLGIRFIRGYAKSLIEQGTF